MRYSLIRKMDISNGAGIGVSLFVQGCSIRCTNCFNTSTWDFNQGTKWSNKTQNILINLLKNPYVSHLSILGGEPLDQTQDDDLITLLKAVKTTTDKTIWLWSGYTFERLNNKQKEILEYVDVLVDGPFVDELKDYSLLYKGSKNQRIIDVKKSLTENKVILWEENGGAHEK